MKHEFIFPVHVYMEDTDLGGVVYHANHIKYMERARATWASSLGLPLIELAKQNIFFIVRHLTIEYLLPARLNDNLEVVSTVTKIGRISLTCEQHIRFASEPEQYISRGEVTLVCINNNLKPISLPKTFIETFSDVMVEKA